MPGNAFIKFEGVTEGESTHESHPGSSGWNEINDWSFTASADTSFLKGSGAAVGKPVPEAISVSKPFDKASPVIMKKLIQGTSFTKVYLVMLKQTGAEDGKGEVYFAMTFQDVFITKVDNKGGEDGGVTQDIEFVCKTMATGYKPQKNTGGLDAAIELGWDISKMKIDDSGLKPAF
ncbi:MAG TPA: type VI secretion system tube protein Hcp [Rubrivivax sp.]|nr:type VI secretion system tube protein Hcp [Rubrivivax sp.]